MNALIMDSQTLPVKLFASFHAKKADISTPQEYAAGWQYAKIGSLAKLAEIMSKHAWSDSLWEDGRRQETSWRVSYFCTLDIDNGYALSQAIKDLSDTCHVIGTTKRHGLKGDRYRIVVPWSEAIRSLDIYRYSLDQIIKKFDGDPSGSDGARFFWPCKDIVSVCEEGEFLQDFYALPKNYIPLIEIQKRTMQKYRAMGDLMIVPPWVRQALQQGVEEGERNNFIYSIAKTLTYCGWDEDKILETIISSKIPKESAPKKEIESAVRSGVKKAVRTMR